MQPYQTFAAVPAVKTAGFLDKILGPGTSPTGERLSVLDRIMGPGVVPKFQAPPPTPGKDLSAIDKIMGPGTVPTFKAPPTTPPEDLSIVDRIMGPGTVPKNNTPPPAPPLKEAFFGLGDKKRAEIAANKWKNTALAPNLEESSLNAEFGGKSAVGAGDTPLNPAGSEPLPQIAPPPTWDDVPAPVAGVPAVPGAGADWREGASKAKPLDSPASWGDIATPSNRTAPVTPEAMFASQHGGAFDPKSRMDRQKMEAVQKQWAAVQPKPEAQSLVGEAQPPAAVQSVGAPVEAPPAGIPQSSAPPTPAIPSPAAAPPTPAIPSPAAAPAPTSVAAPTDGKPGDSTPAASSWEAVKPDSPQSQAFNAQAPPAAAPNPAQPDYTPPPPLTANSQKYRAAEEALRAAPAPVAASIPGAPASPRGVGAGDAAIAAHQEALRGYHNPGEATATGADLDRTYAERARQTEEINAQLDTAGLRSLDIYNPAEAQRQRNAIRQRGGFSPNVNTYKARYGIGDRNDAALLAGDQQAQRDAQIRAGTTRRILKSRPATAAESRTGRVGAK